MTSQAVLWLQHTRRTHIHAHVYTCTHNIYTETFFIWSVTVTLILQLYPTGSIHPDSWLFLQGSLLSYRFWRWLLPAPTPTPSSFSFGLDKLGKPTSFRVNMELWQTWVTFVDSGDSVSSVSRSNLSRLISFHQSLVINLLKHLGLRRKSLIVNCAMRIWEHESETLGTVSAPR